MYQTMPVYYVGSNTYILNVMWWECSFTLTSLFHILPSQTCIVEQLLQIGRRQDVFNKDWSVKVGCLDMLLIPHVEHEVLFSDQPVSVFFLKEIIAIGNVKENERIHTPLLMSYCS